MLEKDIGKILEDTLSSDTDTRLKVELIASVSLYIYMMHIKQFNVQIQSLQNMYEYLLDAENQMGTDGATNGEDYSTDGGESVPVAAGAGDTNICGGIVQLYWDNILGRCLDVNEQVRQYALKVNFCIFYFVT